jgi:hypothetical protein
MTWRPAVLHRLNAWLYRRYGCTFLLMGASFIIFGVLSLSLIYLLRANIEAILEHGTMIIAEGAGRQFIELVVYGYLSLAFVVVFKCCETRLVKRLTGQGQVAPRD